MEVKNFYEELNLDESFSIEEIQDELSRLENLWNHRLVSSPEKASAMLELISEAYDVFKNENTKQEYDDILNGNGIDEHEEERETAIADKLISYLKAKSYYDNGEYDLAYLAIKEGLQKLEGTETDVLVLETASSILVQKKEYRAAIDYLNQALFVAVDDQFGRLYFARGYALLKLAATINDPQELSEYLESAKKSFFNSIQYAEKSNDTDLLGVCQHNLAAIFTDSDPKLAVEYAEMALKNGYSDSQEILDTLQNEQNYRINSDQVIKYLQAKLTYEAELKQAIAEFIKRTDFKGQDFLLAKRRFAHASDQTTNTMIDFEFYIRRNGSFYVKEDDFLDRCAHVANGERYDGVISELALNDICAEFDITCKVPRAEQYDKDIAFPVTVVAGFIKEGLVPENNVIFSQKYYIKGKGLYEKLHEIADSKQDNVYRSLINSFEKATEIREIADLKKSFDQLGSYKDAAKYSRGCSDKIQSIMEKRYSELVAAYQQCLANENKDTISTLNKLADSFTEIANYKDSAEWVKTCKSEAGRIREKNYNQAVSKFNKEIAKFKNNGNPDFESAKYLFLNQNGYKDSQKYIETIEKYIVEQQYRSAVIEAKACKAKADFQRVITLFSPLSDYKQSKEIIEACKKMIGRLDAAEAKSLADEIENDSDLKTLIKSTNRMKELNSDQQSINTILQTESDIRLAEGEINDLKQKISSLGVFDFSKRKEYEDKLRAAQKSILSMTHSINETLANLGYESKEAFEHVVESNRSILKSIRFPANPNKNGRYYFKDGKLIVNVDDSVMELLKDLYPNAYGIIEQVGYSKADISAKKQISMNGSKEDGAATYRPKKTPRKSNKPQKTICILGHGGHGKTTLATAVLKVAEAKGNYSNKNENIFEFETKSFFYSLIDCSGSTEETSRLLNNESEINGAIFVISSVDGPMAQTFEQLDLAKKIGLSRIVVFMNMVELASDSELIELVRMEIQDAISDYGFDRNSPIITGSALQALESGSKDSIKKLLDALDDWVVC